MPILNPTPPMNMMTPRAKELLARATAIAINNGHRYTGGEHILLAALSDVDGAAGELMNRLVPDRDKLVADAHSAAADLWAHEPRVSIHGNTFVETRPGFVDMTAMDPPVTEHDFRALFVTLVEQRRFGGDKTVTVKITPEAYLAANDWMAVKPGPCRVMFGDYAIELVC